MHVVTRTRCDNHPFGEDHGRSLKGGGALEGVFDYSMPLIQDTWPCVLNGNVSQVLKKKATECAPKHVATNTGCGMLTALQ